MTHLVYPSAGGSHSSIDSDGGVDVSILIEVYLGPKWICFTGWAGRWPLDRLSREWAYNQVLQVACRSWPFPCCLRGINLLAFNLLPKCVVGRPLPIAGPEGVLLLDEPTGQILPGVYLHLSLTTQLFDGGPKYIPYPEQAGRLTKFLNARRSRATWVANGVVLNIFLFFNFVVLSCPCALALYVTVRSSRILKDQGQPMKDQGQPVRDQGLPMRGQVFLRGTQVYQGGIQVYRLRDRVL